MKNCRFIISLGLFLILTVTSASAVQVNALYDARLPIADHSDSTRAASLSSGLQQVLIKVSGNVAAATLPQIQSALNSASDYVSSFSYDNNYLDIKFDRAGVLQILHGAHQPVWGANRPLVLVWLTIADASGQYNFVDSDSDLTQGLQGSAAVRGLPILTPIFDMQDLSALSVGDISGQNIQALQKASQRYNADAILSGVISSTDNNAWQSSWLFLDGANAVKWQIAGDSAAHVVEKAINNTGDELAAHYAVVSDNKLTKEFNVVITGVNGLSGYSQVVKYLQSLNVVNKVVLDSVSPGAINLHVTCNGGKGGLDRAISLDSKIVAIASSSDDTKTIATYRWNG